MIVGDHDVIIAVRSAMINPTTKALIIRARVHECDTGRDVITDIEFPDSVKYLEDAVNKAFKEYKE